MFNVVVSSQLAVGRLHSRRLGLLILSKVIQTTRMLFSKTSFDALFQDLLYVLVVCPDVKVHGSGSVVDMEKYVTTLNYSWDVESGKISIQVQWNRDLDIVTVGDQKFDRGKGNVFVVRRETSGEIVGQQLPSLGMHANFSEVLRHVQQQLTNDQFIASLKMYK